MNRHKLPKLLREGNMLHSSIVLITVHIINLSAFYPGRQWAILLSAYVTWAPLLRDAQEQNWFS